MALLYYYHTIDYGIIINIAITSKHIKTTIRLP